MELNDKVALVTGGSGALGSAVVMRLAKAGARVAATMSERYSTTSLPEELRSSASFFPADVTDVASVEELFREIIGKFGRVDIVVHTVGGYVSGNPIATTPVSDWQKMMDLNLKSAFLCTREALRAMLGQPYGRIVNIAAMTGVSPQPGRAAYAISKAGVILLSELAAKESKGTGITVNTIAPSIIDTPANRSSMPDEDFRKWVKPDVIADLICYVCSESAGDVNGTVIRATGGS